MNIIGQKRVIILIFAFMPICCILLGILPLIPALLTIFLFYMVWGYTTPLLRDLTNNNCGSEIRATVISLRSLLFGAALSAGFLGAGLSLLRVHYTD